MGVSAAFFLEAHRFPSLLLMHWSYTMKKFAQLFLTASLAVVVAVSVNADEKSEKKGKGKGKRPAPSVTARLVKGLDLSAEQKEQLKAIDKEFGGKMKEFQSKQTAIVSKEQMAKAREAAGAAKKAGKKGAEIRAAFTAALGLREEQKAQQKELDAARKEAFAGIRAAVSKILTEEQRAKLPGAKGKGGKGKKPAKKDGEKKKKADK